jgi:Zn-finger nucleic acid-binding protein
MVKRSTPLETGETVCPACGAAIKAGSSSRRRRVQCPKCREVVFLESADGGELDPALPPSPLPDSAAAETRGRIASLEARVEALEATLRDAMAAGRTATSSTPQRKLVWVTSTPGHPPAFSPEQGQALFQNLAGVRSQAITIRTPAGDAAAQAHAEWFKSIFERAGWTVLGPEEVAPETVMSGLSLAVPELPVGKEAAATYLALKAAGFEAVPILEPAPRVDSGERAAMSLTLPPVQAA